VWWQGERRESDERDDARNGGAALPEVTQRQWSKGVVAVVAVERDKRVLL